MTTLEIRPIAPADRDGWQPLWDGYNAFYGRSGPTALPQAVTEATWSRLCDPQQAVYGFLAVHEGRIVGLVHHLLHRSTTMLEPTCYLQDLFTAQQARGAGVGRALIEAVYADAAARGAGRVYWHTHESNATARRLYDTLAERPGFIMYRKVL